MPILIKRDDSFTPSVSTPTSVGQNKQSQAPGFGGNPTKVSTPTGSIDLGLIGRMVQSGAIKDSDKEGIMARGREMGLSPINMSELYKTLYGGPSLMGGGSAGSRSPSAPSAGQGNYVDVQYNTRLGPGGASRSQATPSGSGNFLSSNGIVPGQAQTQGQQITQGPMYERAPQGTNVQAQPIDFSQIDYDFATQVESLMDMINDLKAQLSRDDGSMALIARWYADMEASLDQAYQQMLSDMNSQMSQQDPAILAAVQALKEEVSMQRQAMFEELNARGLAQSGILAEMDLRLRRGELTEVQQLTSARLSELKSAVLVAIQNFAQQRSALMQQAFQARTQALQAQLDRRAQIMGNLTAAQASLTDTVGRWGQARMEYEAQLRGYQNAQDVAHIQGLYGLAGQRMQSETQLGVAGIQSQTQRDVTQMNIQGEKDITGMQIQGQKDITGMQIQGQKDLAQMQINADAAKWQAQMANDVTLAGIDAATRTRIAQIQAQNNIDVARVAQTNEVLALQMKAASDSVVNVILPLVASGSLDPQAFLDQIKNQPPEVRAMYEPVLRAMIQGQTTGGGSSAVSTPTWSNNPTVAADQKASYARSLESQIAQDEQRLTDLQAQLTKAEQGYLGAGPNRAVADPTGGGFTGLTPTQKDVQRQAVEYLTAEIEKTQQRIQANRAELQRLRGTSPVRTPTGNTP